MDGEVTTAPIAPDATAGSTDRSRSVLPDIPYLRPQDRDEQRATFFELFFDLVYVFAVTQLSHHLLEHLDWEGAAETALLLVAVYWAWNYTTWMANWFDPDRIPVRLVLVFVMLASLFVAVAIPGAFDDHGMLFAVAYCALQVGRNAFVVVVLPSGPFHRNFVQILSWSVLAVPLWIAGALADPGSGRWVLWIAALGLDLVAPLARYWLPLLGATPMSQWQVDGAHFGERFQLFVIIALGEGIVLAGATAAGAELTVGVAAALGAAFLSSTALWWLYFGGIGELVHGALTESDLDDRGAIARDVYTYLHLPIIAGIVLVAVGDELVIAHPGHDLGTPGALVTLGGPAVFLAGIVACTARLRLPLRVPTVVVTAALLVAIPIAASLPGLVVLTLVTVVLAGLIVVAHR